MSGIFLDSGNTDEITKYHEMGILRGVTTNPSILVKEGVTGGMAGVQKKAMEIAKVINPYPLSIEVTNNDPKRMLDQAKEFAGWADNINVKITIHGPNGETENLKIIHQLETQEDIRINVTAMMSVQQCFLAAMAGATYVSIFGGRINDMGYDSRTDVARLRQLIDQFSLESQIIVGSTREALNVMEWFEAGAHIVTVPPQFIHKMIVHPYSKETVQQFVRDGAQFENSN